MRSKLNCSRIMNSFETPQALWNDADTIADDVRSLVAATAEVADEKVAAARKRLDATVAAGQDAWLQLQRRARERGRAVDRRVRVHPYESVGVAFGIGAILGFLMSRRF